MKKSILLAIIAAFTLAPLASGAVAVNYDIKLTGGGETSPPHGGPFEASIYYDTRANQGTSGVPWVASKPAVDESFYTFCVEVNEDVYLGQWYDIKAIDTTSHKSTNLALSGYSAWVYDKFLAKIDANPSWNPFASSTTKREAGRYQDMIWAGMLPFADTNSNGSWDAGEAFTDVVGGSGTENPGIDLTAAEYSNEGISYAQFLADSSWWGDAPHATEAEKLAVTKLYRVLNLQNAAGEAAQDMAVLIEQPVSGVPEPASLLVWSFLGLAGVSLWSRRGRESLPQRWSRRDREAIYSLIEHGRK